LDRLVPTGANGENGALDGQKQINSLFPSLPPVKTDSFHFGAVVLAAGAPSVMCPDRSSSPVCAAAIVVLNLSLKT
jgi:hypothetical protein